MLIIKFFAEFLKLLGAIIIWTYQWLFRNPISFKACVWDKEIPVKDWQQIVARFGFLRLIGSIHCFHSTKYLNQKGVNCYCHMKNLLIVLLLITSGFVSSKNFEFTYSDLKHWKKDFILIRQIKGPNFKIYTYLLNYGLDQKWEVYAVHKIPSNFGKIASYIIQLNANSNYVDIGISFLALHKRKDKKPDNIYRTYPMVDSQNNNQLFTATGNENVLVVYLKKKNPKELPKFIYFDLNSIKLTEAIIDPSPNLIKNGDFELCHAVIRSGMKKGYRFEGCYPYWNENEKQIDLTNNTKTTHQSSHTDRLREYFKLSSHGLDYGTPDAFIEAKEDTAASGTKYIGFCIMSNQGKEQSRGNEYIQTKLTRKLMPYEQITVSFYYKKDEKDLATNALGIALTDSLIMKQRSIHTDTQKIIYQDGITQGSIMHATIWQKIAFKYVAKGGEEYLTIGDFKTDDVLSATKPTKQLCYYFIDDIRVVSQNQ